MIKRILIGIIVVAVIIGGYFWLSQEKPEEYTGPVEKITLAAYAGDIGALVYITEEQGFFEQNGLDVTIKDYEAGKLAAEALLTGEADISTTADAAFVGKSFDNPDIRILGTVEIGEDIHGPVARKDRDVSTPTDLKDKRIGVTKKTSGEFFFGAFLTFNGLSYQDVELVDLKPSEIIEGVVNGDVDAGFTWEPNIFEMKKRLGENAVSWPGGQSGQAMYFILLAKEKWVKDNPELVERFLRSLVQTEEYIKNNNEEAKNFVAEKFNYESDYIDDTWPKHKYVVQLSQAMIIVLEDQARWRIDNNLTEATKVPNYLNYIHMDALEKVKPEAVGIIH